MAMVIYHAEHFSLDYIFQLAVDMRKLGLPWAATDPQ